MSELNNPEEWRLSKSGFSIRTGWGNEKKMIAKYAGTYPTDSKEFMAWIENAESICELHNKELADNGQKE